jgi:hypothetical protein
VNRGFFQRATMISVACLILGVLLSGSAYAAAQLGGGGLAALMLKDDNLPAGFQPYAPLTGPLDGKRAQLLGLNLSQLGIQNGWLRYWVSPRTGDQVMELAFDAGTRSDAQAAEARTVSSLRKQGLARHPIAGPAHFTGFSATADIRGVSYFLLALPLARGPYFFALRVIVPAQSAASADALMSKLATAQSAEVPASTPDTGTGIPDNANAAGYAVGALLGYVGLLNLIAYFRNPLRGARRRARRITPPSQPEGPAVWDVSALARENRRAAVWRFTAQLAGVAIIAYGADLFVIRYWYLYLAIGLGVIWAAGRFIHPGGAGRGTNRAIFPRARTIRVTLLMSVAMVLVLAGLITLITAGLYNSVPSGSPGQGIPAQDQGSTFEVAGFILVALGAIIARFARRLGSMDAERLMRRDPRPPVLYLRSFGDDALKLWTATLGRSSLIERFTLRRFDPFEEVLVRFLSLRGPVIAVNPPGTRLAPLGAARGTIDSGDWHAAVATWMERSSLIVFVAPPSQPTEGLLWELRAVSAARHWDKTIIVVPPVSAAQLQRRWQAFQEASARIWPFTFALPAADPAALVLAFRNGAWQAITADRRTEWSYRAALGQELGETHPRAPVAGSPPGQAPPEGDHRLLRPRIAAPAAALAVATALGAWYAIAHGSAHAPAVRPAAHHQPLRQPSEAIPTASASPPPPSPAGQPATAGALVSLAPAAAQYPDAGLIQPVITGYFQSINNRDYTGYLVTVSPNVALSLDQFETGFESTQDSNVLVTGISTAYDGRPEADVTFTSRQQPQDGPAGESCTNWQVKMFFDGSPGSYTIGAPPAGYSASYSPC